MNHSNTPIVVGVAEVVERLNTDEPKLSSVIDLAAQASSAALIDSGIDANQVDVLVNVRTMDEASPMYVPAFGASDNPVGSIANKIGASPTTLIHTDSGGNTPQKLVNKWSELLFKGDASVVLLVGAEAKANYQYAKRNGVALDWSDTVGGSYEDQGFGLEGMIQVEALRHGIVTPTTYYALFENAYRSQQNRTVGEHQKAMAKLFAPFSKIAASNPNAMFPVSYTEEEIAEVSDENPYIDFPHTKRMVAKDGVNQSAALVLTTVGKAEEIGIDSSKWVYLHAYAEATELPVLARENLADSKALKLAYGQVLETIGAKADSIKYYDLYSCFPIAVTLAKTALDLDDDVCLTQTGGLAFFGGPGNNYSMHGIAAVVRKLREDPSAYGLVGANGGMLSKHAVGVYSCQPGWNVCDSSDIQKAALDQDAPALESSPEGPATIESYTVSFIKGKPVNALVVGRLVKNDRRFVAVVSKQNKALFNKLLTEDCMGAEIYASCPPMANIASLSQRDSKHYLPNKFKGFRDSYQYCEIAIADNILAIVMNRPEAMNSLHPMAHDELDEIFDAYFDDKNLWVAVITGAGNKAFSAGNDLKYSASGKPSWVPKSGFAGITSRKNRNKPVIAAVNGFAMGGGMEIALACDIVIAEQQAVFSLPEVKRGLIAAAGGVIRISRDIPKKVALDILLTGRDVPAEEAKQLGFVNQVVENGTALSAAMDYAKLLCTNSPSSIQLTLALINEKIDVADSAEAAKFQSKVLDKLIASNDFYEGPKAFAQKRRPNWKLD